jgi:hypothetical protein
VLFKTENSSPYLCQIYTKLCTKALALYGKLPVVARPIGQLLAASISLGLRYGFGRRMTIQGQTSPPFAASSLELCQTCLGTL